RCSHYMLLISLYLPCASLPSSLVFFVTDPATTALYTLSLHDALPIYPPASGVSAAPAPRTRPFLASRDRGRRYRLFQRSAARPQDRKSTRLNSSHVKISYAVFCLKKKKKKHRIPHKSISESTSNCS